MRNVRLDEVQGGIKIARRNTNNLRYADDTTLMTESGEELKSLLMNVKEKSEPFLNLNAQITKIMASGPITSWQIDGETVTDFIFLCSKITVYGDCSHGIKRHLLLGRKAMTILDSVFFFLKQRHYFIDKDQSSQSYGFSSSHVWMWELDRIESWEPKNWCFWTVVLVKTLESPFNCEEIIPIYPNGNQSWIFIGKSDAETEGPILWLPDAKGWLEKTLMLRKIEDERKRGQQITRWLDGIIDSMDVSLSKLWEIVKDREALGITGSDRIEWLNNNNIKCKVN